MKAGTQYLNRAYVFWEKDMGNSYRGYIETAYLQFQIGVIDAIT